MFTDSMNTWLKWALVGTWSVAVLAWAWAWATKLWYIPNWLGIEALCPWNDEVIEKSHRIPEPIDIEEQQLVTPERTGSVAVEWGGTEIK